MKPPPNSSCAQRIAHRVNDGAGREPVRRDLPQLLDADRIELRRTPLVERETPHDRLGQVAADAVGEDRHLRADVDAGLERRLPLAVLADAAIAGAHTDDAIAVVQDLDRRETR